MCKSRVQRQGQDVVLRDPSQFFALRVRNEVERMGGQLGAILDSIERIQELDLEGVPPTANPLSLTNVTRPDEPQAELPRRVALSTAPEPDEELFVVPRID